MTDTSMFNFLFEEDVKNGLDLGTLVEFGKEASNALIGVGNVPLNDTITKIARIHNLDQNQIDIVCQEANKATHRGMYKTAEDHYVQFDVADPNKVKNLLNGEVEKTASMSNYDLDYITAPDDLSHMKEISMTKTASGGHAGLWDDSKRQKQRKMEKIAKAKEELEGQILVKTAALQSKEKEYIKLATTLVGNQTYSVRGDALTAVASYTLASGLGEDRTADLLFKVAKVLEREGIIEKKNATADAIKDTMLAAAPDAEINTTHQMHRVIKTIKNYDKELDNYSRAKQNIVQTENPF